MRQNADIRHQAVYSALRLCAGCFGGLYKNDKGTYFIGSHSLLLPKKKLAGLKEILQLDPRPGYDDSPEKLYGLSFAGYNIKFSVENDVLRVSDIEKIKR